MENNMFISLSDDICIWFKHITASSHLLIFSICVATRDLISVMVYLPTTFPSDSCSKYWYSAMLGSVNLANQQLAWGDMETFDWDRKCFLWLVCVVVLSVSLVVLKRCFWLHHSNSATSKVRIQFGASHLENYLPLRINELNWLRIV